VQQGWSKVMKICEVCGDETVKVVWFDALDCWTCQECIDEFCVDMEGASSDIN
jgi:hypothetical protein